MREENDNSYRAEEDSLVSKHAPPPVSEKDSQTSSARGPKFKPVWQRAYRKIQAKLQILHLGRDIQLYGASTLGALAGGTDLISTELVQKTLVSGRQSEEHTWLFKPGGVFLTLWSWIFTVLMLYIAFIMPYRLAFSDDVESLTWTIIDWIVNAFFTVDICVTLNTPIKVKGKHITSRVDILKAYLKSWLVPDIVACLPLNLMSDSSTSNSNQLARLLRLIRLPRMYRLLRLTRMLKLLRSDRSGNVCLDRVQAILSLKQSALKVIFFIFSIILALHLMGCSWYMVAAVQEFSPDTWVVTAELVDANPADQYIAAVYWAVSTLATVGYGDIVPGTPAERIVCIFWMIFGLCLFSLSVNALASILHNIHTKESILETHLAALDDFAEECKLSKDLHARLRLALQFSTQHIGSFSHLKRNIFNELPRELRFQAAIAMHQGAAKSIPFFADRDQAFIAATVPFLTAVFVGEKVEVYQAGEYSDEIYFISKGYCLYMFRDLVMKKLQRGSYFGETEVIMGIPRRFTVLSAVNSELLAMGRKLLRNIEMEFPFVFAEMKQISVIRRKLESRMCFKLRELFGYEPGSPLSPQSPHSPTRFPPPSAQLPGSPTQFASIPRRLPTLHPTITAREAYDRADKRLLSLETTMSQIHHTVQQVLRQLTRQQTSKIAPALTDF